MLDPLSIVLGAAGAGAAAFLALRRRERDRLARWWRRAVECDLQEIELATEFPIRAVLTGRRGQQSVRIERFQRGKHQRGSRVVVHGLADAIALEREGLGSRIEKTLATREIEIGDAPFDDDLFVRGEPVVVRSLLDSETRRLARELFAGRIRMEPLGTRDVDVSASVSGGALRLEFLDRFDEADEPQADTLQLVLTLAERLAPVERPETPLAAIARTDPLPLVRGHALTTLSRERAAAPETRAAMSAALEDPDPDLRLRAGLWLAEEGQPALLALASSVDVPDRCSARALAALGDSVAQLERARAILDAASGADRVQTVQAALAIVARDGDVGRLIPALGHQRVEIAVAAAQALAAAGSPVAEEPLLQALARGPHPLSVAAAEALGRVGTARSVMPLRELDERGAGGEPGGPGGRGPHPVADRRRGPGQLALSEDSSGQVALAEDPRGRVGLGPRTTSRPDPDPSESVGAFRSRNVRRDTHSLQDG